MYYISKRMNLLKRLISKGFDCYRLALLSKELCSARKYILGNANNICLSINLSIPWHYWCQGIFYVNR